MSVKYEILKRLVKAANIKKMWTGMSTEELLENRRRQNAKNRIPNLKDDVFDISRIEIMGCPVLKLIQKKNRAGQSFPDRRRDDIGAKTRFHQESPSIREGNRAGCVRPLLPALYGLSADQGL